LILSNLQLFSTLRMPLLYGSISSLMIAVIEYKASIATFLVFHSLLRAPIWLLCCAGPPDAEDDDLSEGPDGWYFWVTKSSRTGTKSET
jgi:hypothetical protein